MCDFCNWKHYSDLAAFMIANAIPESQTRRREFVESVGETIGRIAHCTERQREVLNEVRSELGIEAVAPPPASPDSVTTPPKDGRPNILVSPLKSELQVRIREVIAALRLRAGEGPRFYDANTLDWKAIRKAAPDDDKGYGWASIHWDALILVEDSDGLLGRGQFSLAMHFQTEKKRVCVFRDDRAVVVEHLEIWKAGSWKKGYARAVIAGEPLRAAPVEEYPDSGGDDPDAIPF